METDKSDYQVRFRYFRVPQKKKIPLCPHKGKPHTLDVFPYERGKGFDAAVETVIEVPIHLIEPASKGGAVLCQIKKNGKVITEAEAWCSFSDNFCYKIGREIALGRAKKQLEKRRTNK